MTCISYDNLSATIIQQMVQTHGHSHHELADGESAIATVVNVPGFSKVFERGGELLETSCQRLARGRKRFPVGPFD